MYLVFTQQTLVFIKVVNLIVAGISFAGLVEVAGPGDSKSPCDGQAQGRLGS